MQGVEVVGLYVRDQDEALAFYVGKLGFRVHTDVKNGDYRWLTVQHPDQPSFQLGLFYPGAPMLDSATNAQSNFSAKLVFMRLFQTLRPSLRAIPANPSQAAA